MTILETRDLSYRYSDVPGVSPALQKVSFAVEAGSLVGVIGHTGSGKSTLVQHFNGLLRPTEGQVLVAGQDIWAAPKEIRKIRFKVGLVFQYPEHQLFEETVRRDIGYGPRNMGLSEEEVDRRVLEAARFVGLPEELLDQSPFDLSGGEKRRVAVAGVMAMKPEILVLDEPTAGLDPKGQERLLAQVKEYREETGSTVMLVSHRMEDVARVADHVLVMEKGRAVMYDTADAVFSRAEELSGMGLAIPAVTRIFMGLRARGLPVGENVYTARGAADRLLPLLRKGGGDHAS